MLFIGTRNIGTQTVSTNGEINLGVVYRKYCKPNRNGQPTFSLANDGILIQTEGMYHLTLTAVATSTEAGDITVQVVDNGTQVLGEFSTETITTPETELRTLVIDYYILVDSACLLGQNTTIAKSISFINSGVEAIFSKVTVNVEKVV